MPVASVCVYVGFFLNNWLFHYIKWVFSFVQSLPFFTSALHTSGLIYNMQASLSVLQCTPNHNLSQGFKSKQLVRKELHTGCTR